MMSSLNFKSSHTNKQPGSGESKKALFEAYEEIDKEVALAKQVYEAALSKRSDAVKAIHDLYGAGPFNFRDGVTIVIRPNRATKEMTYFFRGMSKKRLEDIEG